MEEGKEWTVQDGRMRKERNEGREKKGKEEKGKEGISNIRK